MSGPVLVLAEKWGRYQGWLRSPLFPKQEDGVNPEKETPPLLLIVIYLYTVEHTFLVAGVGAGRGWFVALYCQLEGMVSFVSDLPVSGHSHQSPVSDYHRAVLSLVSWSVISCCRHVFFYTISLLNRHGVMSLAKACACRLLSIEDLLKIQPPQHLWLLLCPPSLLLPELPFTFWTVGSHVDAKHYYTIMICKSGLTILLLFVSKVTQSVTVKMAWPSFLMTDRIPV